MTTAYPGAIDSFTNPLATDALNSGTVGHASQHDNLNDAVKAVENALGVNPQGSFATVVARLNATTFTQSSISASQAVVAWVEYYVNTTSTAVTLTMPASASVGDEIRVYDAANNAATNNITMNSNGLKINGVVQNFIINLSATNYKLKYTGSTYGWMVS